MIHLHEAVSCALNATATLAICAPVYLCHRLSLPHVIAMAHSNRFPDWMGVPEPTSGASGNSNDGLANVSSSGERIDDVLNFDGTTNSLAFSPQQNDAFDYQAQPSPFAPSFFPTPFGDALSTTYALDPRIFPTSGQTSLNSAGPSTLPESELPSQWDEYVDYWLTSSSFIPYGELPIDFTPGSAVKSPPFPSPFAMDYVAPANDYNNLRAGFPLMQHTVGAAGAGAPGLTTGVDMNADPTAFTSMAPSFVPFHPQGLSHERVQTLAHTGHTAEPPAEIKIGYFATDSGAGDTSDLNKKPPKQDTKDRPSCHYEGCNLSECVMPSSSSVRERSSQRSPGPTTSSPTSRTSTNVHAITPVSSLGAGGLSTVGTT